MYASDNLLYFIIGLFVTKASERVFALFGKKQISSNSMISLEGINHSGEEGPRDVLVQIDDESNKI